MTPHTPKDPTPTKYKRTGWEWLDVGMELGSHLPTILFLLILLYAGARWCFYKLFT